MLFPSKACSRWLPGEAEVAEKANLGVKRRPLKTRDVLAATGITHQILYRYMTLGLIQETKVTSTGQRLFSPKTVAAIRLIQRLNTTGYTLRDIKDIFFKEKRLKRLK
jgi:DNA-binding transcriptional MerR regulator